MSEISFVSVERPLRRKEASAYLFERYGIERKTGTLAKLAVLGGGPVFRKAGRVPLYERSDLDAWAASQIGPRQRSTSDLRPNREKPSPSES